jgi:hypothetical protein
MKQFIKLVLISLATLIFSGTKTLYAQTFEEYKKQEAENFSKFKQEQSDYLNKMRNEYKDYVNKRDQEFSEFLKKEWRDYKVFQGEEVPEKPKPLTIPEFKPKPGVVVPDSKLIPSKPMPAVPPVIVPILLPQPPVRKPETPVQNGIPVTLNFYGVPVYFECDPAFQTDVSEQSGSAEIARYWEKASSSNYSNLVDRLLKQKEQMNLNDYSYYLLVKKFAESLYTGNETGQTLAAWFLMVRSGYGVRLATENKTIVLLLPSRNTIYGKSFLSEEGMKYYIMTKTEGNQLTTYDKDYAGSNRPIDFNISSPMDLGRKTATRNLKFEHLGKTYDIIVTYDQGLVNLYKDYPQLDMAVYFNAVVSLEAKESIAASLKPILTGMTDQQAVNFLLGFVQHSFAYKTDPEQFGREKFFFAEEVFFYPYSDCEDRSVLFSYLVRELLGLNVVGLEYPDHIAAAVQFPDLVPGDYITFHDARFVVSDPTYIGASAGTTMPNYIGVSPSIITMENIRGAANNSFVQWNIAEKGGCYQGSNLTNLVKLGDGSSVLTGYYSGESNFAGTILPGSANVNTCFIGRLTSDGKPKWVKSLAATGNSVGVSAVTGKDGNIFIAGSFRGKLTAGDVTLTTQGEKADAFLASYNTEGNLRWLKKLSLDSIPSDAPIAFSATYTADGKRMGVTRAESFDDFRDYGLFADATGKLVYNGIMNRVFAGTPSSKTAGFASMAAEASPELLKKENDVLLANGVDKGIAGLIAAINLIGVEGVILSGKNTQSALDKYNPAFKKNSPNIYANLGKINFVKKANGIITIMTENGDDIQIDKIKVKNKANISISTMPAGNLQFDVLSGIKVGKMVVWYDLNFIRLFSADGNLLFDYDKDHSQQKVNVNKDILN